MEIESWRSRLNKEETPDKTEEMQAVGRKGDFEQDWAPNRAVRD